MSIAQAVKLAVERGGVDHEWASERNIGSVQSTIHMRNECFARAANESARNDFYAMWTPMYRKHRERA